ncbi:MAG: glycosyltransferase, partial [Candidatus Lokiarchaeota archaeon]|nr:glycosyltransferase [Candidatus Lokiarchaeota archaeon]
MTLKEAKIKSLEQKYKNEFPPEIQQKSTSIRKNHYINLISVVIPLYNEENSIGKVLNCIPNHLNYEIIVVDDGSTDNSILEVKKVENLKIRLIRHKTNQGYGAAILTGLKHARGEIIVTLDSDGQHNPKEIPKVIEPILNNNADIVIGSRYLGKCLYRVPLHTRTGELFIKFMLKSLFGLKIGNNQSGFRALRRETLTFFDQMKYNA